MITGVVCFLKNVLKLPSHFIFKEKETKRRSKQGRRGKYLNLQKNQTVVFYTHDQFYAFLEVDTEGKILNLKLNYLKPVVKFSTYNDYNKKREYRREHMQNTRQYGPKSLKQKEEP